MARRKMTEDEKKKDFSITMNIKLNKLLEDYLIKKGINKSRYIESLVKKDLEDRGENIEPNF
jgi:hypothetical protein